MARVLVAFRVEVEVSMPADEAAADAHADALADALVNVANGLSEVYDDTASVTDFTLLGPVR
jgi:hypothetical protein